MQDNKKPRSGRGLDDPNANGIESGGTTRIPFANGPRNNDRKRPPKDDLRDWQRPPSPPRPLIASGISTDLTSEGDLLVVLVDDDNAVIAAGTVCRHSLRAFAAVINRHIQHLDMLSQPMGTA